MQNELAGRMHDSGERQTFATGAIRDTGHGKPRLDLISPFGLVRLGEWYRLGAIKYKDRNWEAGMPFTRVTASIFRHLVSWMIGDKSEDHLAAIAWNAFALMHYQEVIMLGGLPATLNDMPHYGAIAAPPAKAPVEEWSPQTQALLKSAPDGACIPCDMPNGKSVSALEFTKAVRQRHVYIAGPMRGLPLFNFPAFDAARNRAVQAGWHPISPADMDRASGFHETSQACVGPAMSRTFAKRDTEALLSLRAESGDAIALLPGWEKSTGAVAEFFLARWLGLKILSAETFEPFTNVELHNMSWLQFLKNAKNTIFPGAR